MKKYVVFLLAFFFLLRSIPFETIPTVVVHSGPQFFSLGSNTL